MPVVRGVGAVAYAVLVGDAQLAQLAVEPVVGDEQLLLVVTTVEVVVQVGERRRALLVEEVEGAVLLVVLRQTAFAREADAAEDAPPLSVPAALRLGHVLLVGAERHAQRNRDREELGMLRGENHRPEAAHRVARHGARGAVGSGAVGAVDVGHELLGEHVHVVEAAVVAVHVVAVEALGHDVNHRRNLTGSLLAVDERGDVEPLVVPRTPVVAEAVQQIDHAVASVGGRRVVGGQINRIVNRLAEDVAVHCQVGRVAFEPGGRRFRQRPLLVARRVGRREHQREKCQ